ncbi:MAG: hypothetical protein Q7T03_01755 [Deltaproteobacteria bacterium]|nr:hypothetical protein [Deltaproteobacteria bacterium]
MWPIVVGIAVLACLTDCATPSKVQKKKQKQKKKLSKSEQKEDKPHWKDKTTFTIKGSCWETEWAAKSQAGVFANSKAVEWFKKTPDGKTCNELAIKLNRTKTSQSVSEESSAVTVSGLETRIIKVGTCSNGDYRATAEVHLAGAIFSCRKPIRN